MSMGDKNIIAFHVGSFDLGQRISSQKRVNDQAVGGGFNEKAGMAQVGNFHKIKI